MTEEVIELDNDSVENNETIDTEAQDDNNESWTNKNKSNFKALYKSNKEKERLLTLEQEEKARILAEKEALELEVKQWRELNAWTANEIDKSKEIDSVKEDIFILKNPEAEKYLKEVRDTCKKYNMTYNEAWKFVKVDIPTESLTKTDFNIWKNPVKKVIDYSKVEMKDTGEFTKEQRAEWRKVHWF